MLTPLLLVLTAPAALHPIAHPLAAEPRLESPIYAGSVRLVEVLELANGISVQPTAIVEDSRCPADVMCIQAGRLVIAATVAHDGAASVHQLELGEAVEVAGGWLLFSAVEPVSPPSDRAMEASEYRLNFRFSEETAESDQPARDAA